MYTRQEVGPVTGTVQKWGNSLALRIPKTAADDVGLSEGTDVLIDVCNGRLIVTPAHRSKYSLAELLAGVTKDNTHLLTGPSSAPPRSKR
jgi:antitoxin MazE